MGNNTLVLLIVCMASCLCLNAQGQDAVSEAKDSLYASRKDSIRLSFMLDSVVVQGSNVVHYADRDVWRINKKMRKGASNTAQLLANIPAFDCDLATNGLSYYGKKEILLLVDSLERSDEYVKQLHHMRFDKIDVITQPSGRYADYDVVVNLHTKPDYTGYEGDLSHYMMVLPTNGNGKGRNVKMTNETASFTYTKNKWNFVAWGKYFFMQREMGTEDFSHEQTYLLNNFKEEAQSGTVTKSKSNKMNAYAALDYQISPRHSLSLAYSFSGNRQQSGWHGNMLRTNFSNGEEESVAKKKSGDTDDGRHTLGLYFRGKSQAWRYLVNFNFTHESADYDFEFSQNEDFATASHEKNRMNYIWLNSEAGRDFFGDKLYVGAGYTFNWKDYAQHDRLSGQLLSENTYNRHELWTRMSYRFGPNTNANLSLAAQVVQTKTTGYSDYNMVYRMSGGLYHRFNKDIWLRVNCNSSVSYPELSQVTNYGYFVDSLSWRMGNPALKSSVRHSASLWTDFFSMFNIDAGFSWEPNRIQNVVESAYGILPSGAEGYYSSTAPQNTNYRAAWIGLNVYKQIKNLRLSAHIEYNDFRAKYKDIGHHKSCVAGSLNARYYSDKHKLTINAAYQLDTFNSASVQGWSEQMSDHFEVQLHKSVLNQRLNATLCYCLPVHFTKMTQRNVSSTPATETIETIKLRRNEDHAITLSLSYKFYGGKSVRQYQREMKNEK